MKWTQQYVAMIKKADIRIDGKYVLSVDSHGQVGSRALEILRQAVSRKACVPVTCLAVWQKIFRLRKRKSGKKAKQDTPEKHVEQDTREPCRLHSRSSSPEMPTLLRRLLPDKRSRSPTPPLPRSSTPPLPRSLTPPPPSPPPRSFTPPLPQASAEDDNELSQYEKNRLATIARNNAMMSALGIGMPSATTAVVKRTYNKKPKNPETVHQSPRISERTCGRKVDYTEIADDFDDGDKSRK